MGAHSSSFWPSPAGREFPGLAGEATADVTIIGAGFVGLSAALELAQGGLSVTLLDAGQVGAGASAIGAGHVGPMMYGARKGPDDVIKRLGPETGARLNEQVARSGAELFRLIEDHHIDCDARRGYVGVYRSERSVDKAAERFAAWRRYGGRARRLEPGEVRDHIASDRYPGGFLIEDGGWLNPLKLLVGLAGVAHSVGVEVHGNERVVSVVRDGAKWRVQTQSGAAIVCRHVLLATGAGSPGFAGPGITRSVYRMPCGLAATSPGYGANHHVLPGGGPVADFDDGAVFAPVIDPEGRLVVSFLARSRDLEMDQATAPARRRLAKLFGLDIPLRSIAMGEIPITPDGLPRIIRRDDGLLAVTGCNGFGLTLGMVAARESARLILGSPAQSLSLPVSAPKVLPAYGIMPAILRNIIVPLANRLGQ